MGPFTRTFIPDFKWQLMLGDPKCHDCKSKSIRRRIKNKIQEYEVYH